MAEKKRQCGTCRFFVEKENSGHGKCTHPKRAGIDADLLLLRPTELACRTRWGTSLWQDHADDRDPNAPDSPQQPTLPEPIAAQLQFDDEVTSVSIAGSTSSRSSFEDDVIDSGATATGMASWNDPVQEERLNLLRRGSQDALAGARKRHMEKQARQRELIPFADDEDTSTEADPSPTFEKSESRVEPAAERKPTFPADDFVEDERTTTEDDALSEDEMVDAGVARERKRSPRLRNLIREPHTPKRNEAMRVSMPSEMQVTSHNPEQRHQWNSVPTLNPGIELPLSKREDRAPSVQDKLTATAATTASPSYQPRPVSQAREILSEDRLRQERSQRQMVAPLLEIEHFEPTPAQAQPITDRPRLTEAPSEQGASVDRLKASPLRGYHPATRKLTQPDRARPQQQQPSVPAETRTAQARPEPKRTGRPSGQWNVYDASPAATTDRSSRQRPGRTTQPPAPHRREQIDEQPLMQRREQPMPPRRQARPDDRAQMQRPEQSEQKVPIRRQVRPDDQPQIQRSEQIEQPDRRPRITLQDVSEPFEQEEIEIAPHVARACGTCTSYRPSDVSGRGSCVNGFAGPVRRVVYEQDLACKHTYGSFWIPADEEVWLKELPDTSAPTPRVDAMLARRRRRNTTTLPDLDELTS